MLHEYKCPNCHGLINYHDEQIICEYCDTCMTIQEYDKFLQKKASKSIHPCKPGILSDENDNKFQVFQCQSCNAELVVDETTAVTHCPYCDNNILIKAQFQGAYRPDYILPFEIPKEEAEAALREFLKYQKLIPYDFSKKLEVSELTSLYVPFWLFDVDTSSLNIYRHTTSSSRQIRGSNRTVVTRRSHSRKRGGDINFKNIPIQASSKMPPDFMFSLAPFNYSKLKEFSPGYLAGYISDQWDLSLEKTQITLVSWMKSTSISKFKYKGKPPKHPVPSNPGFLSCDLQILKQSHRSVLLPVFVFHTKYKDDDTLFMINGQTGKVVGNLPECKHSSRHHRFDLAAKSGGTAGTILATIPILAYLYEYITRHGEPTIDFESILGASLHLLMWGWSIGFMQSEGAQFRAQKSLKLTKSYSFNADANISNKPKCEFDKRIKGSSRVTRSRR